LAIGWREYPGRHYSKLVHNTYETRLERYTLRLFTKTLGWSLEDTKVLISKVKEITNFKLKDLRLYSNFHLVISKKPENTSREL
jgi:hypothetical protein